MPFARRVKRAARWVIPAQVVGCASLLLYSHQGTDDFFDLHWKWSTPVLIRRPPWFDWYQRRFYMPTLTAEERLCLQEWVSVMGLEVMPQCTSTLSRTLNLQDTFAFLDGLHELQCLVQILARCVHRVTPTVYEVRREQQGAVTFLHCKCVSDVEIRFPLTQIVVRCGRIPSTTTLQLERESAQSHSGEGERWVSERLVVRAAEHRWFGGPLCSHQSNTLRSPWGDMGDLYRRWNGFLLAGSVVLKDTLVRYSRTMYVLQRE